MKPIHVISGPAKWAVALGLLTGFLATAGCSDSAATDKREDPALKASMQKSLEIYKTKTQTKSQTQTQTRKASPANGIKRPS